MSSHVRWLENLPEAVPEAWMGVDQSRVIWSINHQTERPLGYDRDDVDISSPRIDTGDVVLDHGGA